MKKCSKCNEKKDFNCFGKNSKGKDGHQSYCKECLRSYNKKYYEENIEYFKDHNKNYDREKANESSIKSYHKHKEKHRDKKNEYAKSYREKNPDNIKKWREQNVEHRREYRAKYQKEKRANDKLYHLKTNIRSYISTCLKKNYYPKKSKTENMLGCSFHDLKSIVENQFDDWMSWDNYGKYNGELYYGWDLDHIIPLSSAVTEEELLKLFHYKNIQPLCSKTNRDIKKDKI